MKLTKKFGERVNLKNDRSISGETETFPQNRLRKKQAVKIISARQVLAFTLEKGRNTKFGWQIKL